MDDILTERLKRLQEQLLRIYTETVDLCNETEQREELRQVNEFIERRAANRVWFRRRTDSPSSES